MSDLIELQIDAENIFEPEIRKIQETVESVKTYLISWFRPEQETNNQSLIKDTESKKNR